MVLSAFAFLSLLFFLMLIYWLCYCRARRNQQQSLHSSFRILVGELPQQRASAQAEERTVDALQALPRTTWSGAKENASRSDAQVGAVDEQCCLCLENYESEQEVRVLPCSHYFHTQCIDGWFAARSFLPRSCPQCRQNPVPVTGQATAGQQTRANQGNNSSSATVTGTGSNELQTPSTVVTYGRTSEAAAAAAE